jgi:hypothetical protein
MKTYEEIMDEVVTEEYKRINPVAMNIHKNVAKRYAKQWVEQVVKEVADVPPSTLIQYYHLAIDAQ